jgi:LysR family transcriptional activator of mexEF-oprN operon
VAVPSFRSVGTLIDGTPLLATVPRVVAQELMATRPHLRALPLPFEIAATPVEMLWQRRTDDDEALAFVREHIVRIATRAETSPPQRRSARALNESLER